MRLRKLCQKPGAPSLCTTFKTHNHNDRMMNEPVTVCSTKFSYIPVERKISMEQSTRSSFPNNETAQGFEFL